MPNTYLERNTLYPPLIGSNPEWGLTLVVTIPCFDEPDLLSTLSSLGRCSTPPMQAEVIVVVNNAAGAPREIVGRNNNTYQEALAWAEDHSRQDLQFEILYLSELPPRHAGVGLARKIAMDEAARRLVAAENPSGIITCLDADSRVQANYLQAVCRYFDEHPGCPAANIHYEHPLEGRDFAPEIYEAIVLYELHLRYYVHALRRAGLRAATQTVGSAMAVRADAYMAQGGMNRRQAGEDFYFLHKFTPMSGFGTITTTTVTPSPRPSHRVPFGTGKVIGQMIEGQPFLSYAPQIFDDLHVFLGQPERWYGPADFSEAELVKAVRILPDSVRSFLQQQDFSAKLRELRQHSGSAETFVKRFFRWFDPFLAMKYVHHARDRYYPGVPVETAVRAFLQWPTDKGTAREMLAVFRDMDRREETDTG
ncbi:MAG: glycosyltransferase family 2 protein [Saprospiraceae bacterium]